MEGRGRSGVWQSLRDGDLDEGDVWDVLEDSREKSGSVILNEKYNMAPKKVPTASRIIPRSNLSSVNSNEYWSDSKFMQQSAPVNIPDWSKVSGKKNLKNHSKKNGKKIQESEEEEEEGANGFKEGKELRNIGSDEENEEEYNYMVPPHEIIARRFAKSHISSFSVFEGVGRTLKGRDLKRVRNAVLIRTGFLESL